MNFRDAMARYHGEIERNLYAAELLCPNKEHKDVYKCKGANGCPFYRGYCSLICIRGDMGEHRPPGLCPHGEEEGTDILCNSPESCEYQYQILNCPLVFCRREEAALALAEEPAVSEAAKEIPPEPAWVSAFLKGYCTDKKWARKYLDELRESGRLK